MLHILPRVENMLSAIMAVQLLQNVQQVNYTIVIPNNVLVSVKSTVLDLDIPVMINVVVPTISLFAKDNKMESIFHIQQTVANM